MERRSKGHFRLEQKGFAKTQMLAMPIYEEQFVWTKCFSFCVATQVLNGNLAI